jgi:PAS domain S-box-containing protein
MARVLQERPLDFRGNDAGRDAVQQIAERISATVGADYFHAIAKHLAKALAADCVLIGEFVGGHVERVKSVAAVIDARQERLDFVLPGSASLQLMAGKSCLYRSGARKLFPHDALLARLRAEAVAGVPLLSAQGVPIGLMAAIYRHPVSNLSVPKSLLKVFAPRCSAELARKQEEERLRESEQRYRVFVARNPIGMWRIEFEQPIPTDLPEMEQFEEIYRHGYLAECNESLAGLLEVERPDQLIGSRLEKLVPRSEGSAREATLRLIRSGYRFTISEVDLPTCRGKQKHHVRTEWGILEDGKLIRIWGTTQDVTELKRSQRAVEAWERRVASLLDVVRFVVVVLDLNGEISYGNGYLKKLTAWRFRDLIGKNWLDILVPAEEHARIRELTAAMPASRGPTHFESTLLGSAGTRWRIEWDGTVLRNAEGDVEATVLIGRDITEQRAMEEQLRQSQKLDGIGRLAGGIAHDFNNLLTVIVGYCALLLQKSDLADSAHSAIDEIRKAAERGAQLTHQLLAFSRRQVLRPQVVPLNALVEDAEGMLRRLIGDDVVLITELNSEAGCVRADPGHLHQVLMNLVVNARDAMPHGGPVTVASKNVMVDSAHAASFPGVPAGDYVVLSVTDAGTGMTDEVRRHLFEPFFTTKEHGKGTGMGLPMVYGIVHQTGGHITVDSEPGKGTCVRIFLPRAEAVAAFGAMADAQAEVPGGSETILVVEDHPEVRAIAVRTLRGLGYDVIEAESPAYAIELAEGRSDIQLLLTDVMMPGMSGSSLAHLFLQSRPNLRVLLMSGHTDVPDVAESIGESGMDFLRKPFTPAVLAVRVREALDREP